MPDLRGKGGTSGLSTKWVRKPGCTALHRQIVRESAWGGWEDRAVRGGLRGTSPYLALRRWTPTSSFGMAPPRRSAPRAGSLSPISGTSAPPGESNPGDRSPGGVLWGSPGSPPNMLRPPFPPPLARAPDPRPPKLILAGPPPPPQPPLANSARPCSAALGNLIHRICANFSRERCSWGSEETRRSPRFQTRAPPMSPVASMEGSFGLKARA